MKRMQSGFSIVELMIAMLLGSLVVLAATQLFVANQQMFGTQQSVSRVLDDGQLLMRFLGTDARQAGYSGGSLAEFSGVVSTGANPSEEADPFDRLTIRYVGEQDCQGSVSAGGPVDIINSYFVNNDGELVCDGNLGGGTVTLVDGVEAFRVLYGLDTAQDGEVGPMRFVGANIANAAGDPILALKVGILMGVDSEGLPLNEEREWRVLDRTIQTGEDRVTRRLFLATFMLRNMNWEEL